jgi:hypothetical protein
VTIICRLSFSLTACWCLSCQAISGNTEHCSLNLRDPPRKTALWGEKAHREILAQIL